MSKDSSSGRSAHPKRTLYESKENEFHDLFTQFPPPRTPLNSIADPSQFEIDTKYRKSHSEPNSAQTTPLRRTSNAFTSGVRHAPYTKGTSLFSKPTPVINSEPSVHFELSQDPSFWENHNVQVLVRIRPLNNTEKASQEYGRCLRQESANTLVWLGHPETRFTFDHVASETVSQEKLFTVAGLPMVDNCMSGYNSCMFAYGQTGSGKTFTMMGDLGAIGGKLCEQGGITPRIFDYLFTRIREEEDKQRNEGLKYSCKCSFIEIYNEQITDLLEPSSTNLPLREDLKKGVYVENLTEVSVSSVDEVLRILLQGAANRKIAATHMNTESSRSHSVFTCNIESCWEKDSVKHFRFGRLNLVDLAGSERQKSSWAAGDRLKEAANINKSLSTLGLVIMSLVDLAHGKHRHVPYRDSRLTFILQDSLGGNSKTTVIATVSPSFCSASETLSTLKFAQRAKLIQNNAKVNEDASGDVSALQRQIQQLKGQLSFLLRRQRTENYFSENVPCLNEFSLGEALELSEKLNVHNHRGPQCAPSERDPELSRLAHENTSLLKQLSWFKNFYDNTDPGKLVAESREKETRAARELEECREMNSKVLMEVDELQGELGKHLNYNQAAFDSVETISSEADEVNRQPHELPAAGESKNKEGEKIDSQHKDVVKELHEAGSLIGTIELEQVDPIEELDVIREENQILTNHGSRGSGGSGDLFVVALQAKLEKMCKDLEEVRLLNTQHLEDHTFKLLQEQQTEIVRDEVERETVKAILHMQEEIVTMKSELEEKICLMANENMSLKSNLVAKEEEMKVLRMKWERATLELTTFLADGSRSLQEIENIASSFPDIIGEHVVGAAKICVDKDKTILLLKKSLEEAQRGILHMDEKLISLRGATMASLELLDVEDPVSAPQYHITGCDSELLHQIRYELVETNEKLNHVMSNFNEILNPNLCRDSTENPSESDGCTTDCSTSCSYLSAESVALGKRSNSSSLPKNLNLEDATVLHLRRDFKMVYGAFAKINAQFNSVFNEKGAENRSTKNISSFSRNCRSGVIMDKEELDGAMSSARMEDEELGLDQIIERTENMELRKELDRKKVLLEGLLFDISLLQESVSCRKNITDEVEKLIDALNQSKNESSTKEGLLNEMLIQQKALENRLAEMENALIASKSELGETRRGSDTLSKQSSEMQTLLEDLYVKKSQTEDELEEQREIVKNLENEILRLISSSAEKQDKATEDDLKRVTREKKQLLEELRLLQDRLDMAYSLANENEAIATEARQASEASKMYAEQKDEEVKILEYSVEELEGTINVLESKVHEMEVEVERDRVIRESLELELQVLRKRLVMVENAHSLDMKSSSEVFTKDQLSMLVEPTEAYNQIGRLEEEKTELTKEIKDCREYISEILLHSQAQASQYQQKYAELELLVRGLETHHSLNTTNGGGGTASDKEDKCSTRIRGSNSPFRCISSLVQQMNSEKDQELSAAKFHIQELEALLTQNKKEICLLYSRLAATESMTHDVIRDLVGVKLDMTSYANLINQYQVQKFVEEAQQQSEERLAMERELSNLRRRIDDLVEEREGYIVEAKKTEADKLSFLMSIEQLHEREQLLIAQNEMLKMDKIKLQRKLVELDDMGKRRLERHTQVELLKDIDVSKRLGHPHKLVLGAKDKLNGHSKETKVSSKVDL